MICAHEREREREKLCACVSNLMFPKVDVVSVYDVLVALIDEHEVRQEHTEMRKFLV